jgi:hypothetical protein
MEVETNESGSTLAEQRPTVGDWVVLDAAGQRVLRVLGRMSVFRRMAAGDKVDVQLVAANVDTVFVVSSCNAEFNPSRLERNLAWTLDAGVEAVLVLTKADLALRCDIMDRHMLMQAEPEVFYVTDHYLDYPMVLIDLLKVRWDAIPHLVEQGWRIVAPPHSATHSGMTRWLIRRQRKSCTPSSTRPSDATGFGCAGTVHKGNPFQTVTCPDRSAAMPESREGVAGNQRGRPTHAFHSRFASRCPGSKLKTSSSVLRASYSIPRCR